jgi:hypothetical protein
MAARGPSRVGQLKVWTFTLLLLLLLPLLHCTVQVLDDTKGPITRKEYELMQVGALQRAAGG